ncbi:MAG: PadR family transcriptional regulator [Candidatus Micrarchaeota archaeon]|nr:PadR family transcriptional regulator [Candidatus Micrarchaeota archaeon]
MADAKRAHPHGFPAVAAKHAPVISLFFIWRLKGAPRHAYSLIKDIRDVGFLQCKPSTVYALLSKMEEAGLVKSHVDTNGRHMRRLYQTTAKGSALLASTKASRIKGVWRGFVEFLLS